MKTSTLTFSEAFFISNADYFKKISPIVENYVTYTCYSTSDLNSDDTEYRYFIIQNEIIFEYSFRNFETQKISITELLQDIKDGFIFKGINE